MLRLISMIKELSNINGTSGREERVREYIIEKITGHCEFCIDPLGNIIGHKAGKTAPEKSVIIDAHMDEVGFIITGITDDGYLHFSTVGGIKPSVIAGRTCVVGESEIIGIFGIKPIHLVDKKDELKVPSKDEMYIDIGAISKEDALKYVLPGDSAYFVSEAISFGSGFIKGKALDDRVGCAVLIDMITNNENDSDFYFSFTVQEEVGARGAVTAAFNAKPDYAIILETTTAADISGSKGDNKVCICGNGPAVSFMDNGTVYDRTMFKLAFECAEKQGILCQPKTKVAGGNNSRSFQTSRNGVKTLAVSVPCRYLHSPSCVIQKNDIIETERLLYAVISGLQNDFTCD